MDPNTENPPPSAQITEVDVDLKTEVSTAVGSRVSMNGSLMK